MKSEKLAASLSDIAARCPREKLDSESRYVIVADLRMGDGGKKDELAGSKKTVFSILGKWYLPRGYTLVLNGDVEDLRNHWIKDIVAAWPRMYALFDAFAEAGRLRKILGERDLTLLRLSSSPYQLLHGLSLEGRGASILVTHGHQASPPYVYRDYLSDYIQQWVGTSKRPPTGGSDDGKERYKAERRMYRAASRLGTVLVEGHTRRPLFESFAKRELLASELEKLFHEVESRSDRPGVERSAVDEFIQLCRREAKARAAGSRAAVSGPGYGGGGEVSPCLFCPGRLVGARSLRMLEIEGGEIRQVRWTKSRRRAASASSSGGEGSEAFARAAEASRRAAEAPDIEGSPFARSIARSASLREVLGRTAVLAREEGGRVGPLLALPD